MIKNVIFLSLLFLFCAGYMLAQVKKEIIPMHSTCSDVKKILQVETCRDSYEFYRLSDESIEIEYSTEICQKAFKKKWNVPVGTVLSVTRIFKKSKQLSDFAVDTNKCEKTDTKSDIPNQIIYTCLEDGTSLWVIDGLVNTVIYTPTTKDKCLLCK